MMSRTLQQCVAVATLEFRTSRRATATWLVGLLAVAAGWSVFVFYHHAALQHYTVGHFSGNIVPGRFLMGGYAACFFLPLLAGAVFLALDHRQRDRAIGALEALEARPVSNVAFFIGRLLALATVLWLACLVFVVLMQTAGLAADRWLRQGALDGWLGPVEPWSLAAFLFVDAPPALALWSAVVLFLATALRNRLAVALVGLALLGGYAWLLSQAPLRLLPAVSALSGLQGFASDMLPRLVTFEIGAQRAMLLLLALGTVGVGAASYPRNDGAARPLAVAGGVALASALVGIWFLAQSAWAGEKLRATWLNAHLAERDAAKADLVRLAADVSIDPGNALNIDATLALALPADSATELVFSLNPGLRPQRVWFNGDPVPYTHEHGLLRVASDAALAGTDATLRVTANGVPDGRFAYLDGIVDPLALSLSDGHYRILGNEAMVFSDDYAVLLPGLKWLPTPGANLQNGAPDFHDLDLRLDLPADWHAAAPGEAAGNDERWTRFRTAFPVPLSGLVAGRFERYAARVGGVEMELLLHPGHRRNAEFFAPQAAMLLNQFLGMQLVFAKPRGVAYPYPRFSVVEVPGKLRGFGGGWQLDTTLALPGIALLREYGLPSMRMTMQPIHMVSFFMNADYSGGDPRIALYRSLLRYQAAAIGEHATILNFVMDRLAMQAIFGYSPAFFSAHHYDASGAGAPAELLHRLLGHATAVDRELQAAAGRISVSDEFLANALGDLNFAGDAERALDLLNFKGRVLARMLAHGWPAEGASKLLGEVVSRHRGGTYTLEDLAAAGAAVGAPLDSVVGEWWATARLPGFVTSPLEAYRLPDDAEGGARYQARVHVCNAEPVPGLVRLTLVGSGRNDHAFSIHPVAADTCVEVGQVTSWPPEEVKLGTYLSRNADGIAFPSPAIDAERTVDAPPLEGARESAWRPPATADVVVDDVSPGFAVDDEAERPRLRIGWRQPTWERRETAGSWGRYARTAVWSEPGAGDRAATFSARLPTLGRWRLDYHLPGPEVAELEGSVNMSVRFVRDVHRLGGYEMTLVEHGGDGETRTAIEFDASIAEAGWNHLGDFDLAAREVSLVVTDRTDGEVVIADAIRWQPAS